MKHILLFFLISFFLLSQAQTTITIGATQVQVDTIATGLDIPWEVIYASDNSLWVTERKGLVSKIEIATGNKEVLLDLTSMVVQQAESGLLGMALHPDFETTPEVFLAYTFGTNFNIRERIVKYTYQNNALVNEVILIDEIPGNSTHNGCRLFFLPDNTLLASTGDAQVQTLPQDTSSLNGKMLRLNTDGTIPSDNPFPNSYVYSFGHRNVQGICALPNGDILVSEHGASTDDEVQILESGANYGWPNVEGFCSTPNEINFCNANNVVEPLLAYTPTIAPSDMIFYQNNNFPEWNNRVLLTILKDKEIRALQFSADFSQITSDNVYLENTYERLRDIALGANGTIFLASSGQSWSNTDPNTHFIVRLSPPPPTDDTTSILTINSNLNFLLYPNPGKDFLQIQNHNNLSIKSIQILDLHGRSVMSINKPESFLLDISALPAACYFVRIQTDNQAFQNLLWMKE